MTNLVRAQLGRVVPIRYTVRKVRVDSLNGQRQRVNGCSVIVIKPDGTTLAPAPTVAYERTGVYVAHIDTSALGVGDYLVQATFGVGFDTATGQAAQRIRRNTILRLVVAL